MGGGGQVRARGERMGNPVREIPIMWPSDIGGWRWRILLDDGEGCPLSARYRWHDGTPVKPDELDRVARELVRAGGGEHAS